MEKIQKNQSQQKYDNIQQNLSKKQCVYQKNLTPFTTNTKQSFIPFLYKTKRSFPYQSHLRESSPPVGSYQLPSTFQDNKNNYSILEQRNIYVDNYNHKKQNHMFKSTLKRFTNHQTTTPDPTKYTQQKCFKNTSFSQDNKKFIKRRNANQSFRDILNLQNNSYINKTKILPKSPFDNYKNCPSIPNLNTKYGYTHDKLGHAKIIKKTQEQLLKQKQKSKQYNLTLIEQKKYSQDFNFHNSFADNSFINDRINAEFIKTQYNKIKNKFESSEQDFINKARTSRSTKLHILNKKQRVKPKIYNIKKLTNNKANRQQKSLFNSFSNSQISLGPGHYDLDLNTIKPLYKRQKHQFFGSTAIRFKQDSFQQKAEEEQQLQYYYPSLPRDIPDYCAITSSFSKFYKKTSQQKRKFLPLRKKNGIQKSSDDLLNKLPGQNQNNPNVIRKNAQKTFLNNKQKKFYDYSKLHNQKTRNQERKKYKNQIKLKDEAEKQFILKTTKQMTPIQAKGRFNFDEKSLKKKRLQGMYKYQTPEKPQSIKGIIVKVGLENLNKQNLKNKLMQFSKGKNGHTRSKHTNDFELCSWQKEINKSDQKIFGFRMKKIDTQDLNSIHISPHNNNQSIIMQKISLN